MTAGIPRLDKACTSGSKSEAPVRKPGTITAAFSLGRGVLGAVRALVCAMRRRKSDVPSKIDWIKTFLLLFPTMVDITNHFDYTFFFFSFFPFSEKSSSPKDKRYTSFLKGV